MKQRQEETAHSFAARAVNRCFLSCCMGRNTQVVALNEYVCLVALFERSTAEAAENFPAQSVCAQGLRSPFSGRKRIFIELMKSAVDQDSLF